MPVGLESIPVFVRAGGFVFRQPAVQHTGQMSGQPLRVFVYPGPDSEARLYEDDGQSRAYLKGAFLKRRFRQKQAAGALSIDVEAAEGSFRPAARSLELRLPAEGAPRRVLVGKEVLPALTADRLASAAKGWARMDDGSVVLKMPDRFDAFRVTLER